MKKVAALVTQSILQSNLKDLIGSRCRDAGAEVTWINVTESTKLYKETFNEYQNIITWNCRMPHAWIRSKKRNVLFLDNSLIHQRYGVSADSDGYFSKSHFCEARLFNTETEFDFSQIAKGIGFTPFTGGRPDGPILVAMQCRVDCNVNMEFPLAAKHKDKMEAFLNILHDHLPRRKKVLIRAHPRDQVITGKWRKEWRLEKSNKLSEILPKCSALVTVNSTCASEAVFLGVPVAVFGTGVFTGSKVVIDCSKEPRSVGKILSFKQDINNCKRYCAALMNHATLPYAGDRTCSEFDRWLSRLT